MNKQFKQIIKQTSVGFCMAALLGSLAACSGSGSPAASAPANNNGNGGNTGGGNNGGNTGGTKPCIDKSIPKPNVLFPTFAKNAYEYVSNENDTIKLEYDCAKDAKNGSTSVDLYPLKYALPIQKQKFTVNEFMSSSESEVTLHGYKIVDVPLSIILKGDAKTKISVSIFPEKPLKLLGDSDTEGDLIKHENNSVKFVFDGLTTPKFYELLEALVPSLKEAGFFKDLTKERLLAGIGVLKGTNFNPLANGLPVSLKGQSVLFRKAQQAVKWKETEGTAVIREVKQEMTFTISSNDFISPAARGALGLIGISLDFSFDIVVDAVYLLEPNVGPIKRDYRVRVVNTAASAQESASTSTDKEFSFITGITLRKILAGDTDNDYIMDVVDDKVTTNTVK